MTTTIKKVETLTIHLATEAGALAKVYRAFKEAGVNIIGSWGFEMGPGHAEAIFYAEDTAKAKDVLTKLDKNPTTGNACFVTGTDKIGTYSELLEKIAAAGVNLNATDAIGVGGNFATLFFAGEKDFPNLCKALGV